MELLLNAEGAVLVVPWSRAHELHRQGFAALCWPHRWLSFNSPFWRGSQPLDP